MAEIALIVAAASLAVLVWLALGFARLRSSLKDPVAAVAPLLEEKHRAMLTDLHIGLTQQGGGDGIATQETCRLPGDEFTHRDESLDCTKKFRIAEPRIAQITRIRCAARPTAFIRVISAIRGSN